jgi:hypothetical protein
MALRALGLAWKRGRGGKRNEKPGAEISGRAHDASFNFRNYADLGRAVKFATGRFRFLGAFEQGKARSRFCRNLRCAKMAPCIAWIDTTLSAGSCSPWWWRCGSFIFRSRLRRKSYPDPAAKCLERLGDSA